MSRRPLGREQGLLVGVPKRRETSTPRRALGKQLAETRKESATMVTIFSANSAIQVNLRSEKFLE